jgi:hypothetical protein
VVEGLVFLSEQGLEHGSLTCSNILISKDGAVKIGSSRPPTSEVLLTWPIGACENCRPRKARQLDARTSDVKALERITAQLIGGYVNHEGVACLPDLERWPSVAATFLADVNSAMSVHQLQKVSLLNAHGVEANVGQHELLKLSCAPEQLKSVVSRAIRRVRINLEEIPPSV